MHEAAPGERNELGLLLLPLGQGLRPLARASDLEGVRTRQDDAAVDDADDERPKLLRRHDDHRLVEERETLAHATCLHQHVTLCVQRHREEVAIAEAFADRRRLARDGSSLLEVSGCLMLEDEREHQKSVFRGLLGPRLEEALRAAEPARGRPDEPSVREVHPDPRRRPGCAQRLAALRVEVMCPLEGRDRLVIASEHQQRHRQKLEIFGRERLGLVCLGERLVRREPGGLGVCGAGALEVGLGACSSRVILQQVTVGGGALTEKDRCRQASNAPLREVRLPGFLGLVGLWRRRRRSAARSSSRRLHRRGRAARRSGRSPPCARREAPARARRERDAADPRAARRAARRACSSSASPASTRRRSASRASTSSSSSRTRASRAGARAGGRGAREPLRRSRSTRSSRPTAPSTRARPG